MKNGPKSNPSQVAATSEAHSSAKPKEGGLFLNLSKMQSSRKIGLVRDGAICPGTPPDENSLRSTLTPSS